MASFVVVVVVVVVGVVFLFKFYYIMFWKAEPRRVRLNFIDVVVLM